MRKLLRWPSPAMVVACLALLVALGGTGMAAATQLAREQCRHAAAEGRRGIEPEDQEQRRQLRRRSPRAPLLRSDFAPGQLPAGPDGFAGAARDRQGCQLRTAPGLRAWSVR